MVPDNNRLQEIRPSCNRSGKLMTRVVPVPRRACEPNGPKTPLNTNVIYNLIMNGHEANIKCTFRSDYNEIN